MGCDIHAAIEYRDADGTWTAITVPNPYFGKYDDEPERRARLDIDRDYELFAILGNVRNSSNIEPMTEDRGYPEDISSAAEEAVSHEHSATWATLADILAYDWTRKSTHSGLVNAVEFEKWDRSKKWSPRPQSYCGGVGGGAVRQITEDEMRAIVRETVGDKRDVAREDAITLLPPSTYCQVSWTLSYAESGKQIWTAILPQMLKLGAQYGHDNVRLVMDFDS